MHWVCQISTILKRLTRLFLFNVLLIKELPMSIQTESVKTTWKDPRNMIKEHTLLRFNSFKRRSCHHVEASQLICCLFLYDDKFDV